MKTSELTGAALDWAVAKCEYPNLVWGSNIGIHHASHQIVIPHLPELQCYWNPSTNWPQGGPIIEREKITVAPFYERWVAALLVGELIRDSDGYCMTIAMWQSEPHFYGPTPLIAAMRCYVASKLGDKIDIPKELT